MALYRYRAIDNAGQSVSGSVEASSLADANAQVFRKGLTTLDLTVLNPGDGTPNQNRTVARHARCATGALILFTKQMGTSIKVGIPLNTSLQTLQKQVGDKHLAAAAGEISVSVTKGNSLSASMRAYPGLFSELYCSMVEAGETSGNLPEVLERLVYLLEHQEQVSRDLRTAARYPIMVCTALLLAFFGMSTFIMPKFASMFLNANIHLPMPTRVSIAIGEHFSQFWYLWIFALVGSILGLRWFLRTPNGVFRRDQLLLQLPLVRDVVIKSAMTRFASIFAILYSSGILIVDSMNILAGALGNKVIGNELLLAKAALQEGKGLAAPLQAIEWFPPLMINMIATGEETGELERMLRDMATYYQDDLNFSIKRMTDAINPILIITLTVVIGFFALAIYLPMLDLTQMAR